MYGVLNKLSEYRYFYISKNITSYTFYLDFKIVESLPCILNIKHQNRMKMKKPLTKFSIWHN